MSGKSAIEWTEATWNPTKGCDRVSAGCDNCYALTMAKRLKAMGSPGYQLDGDPRTSGPGFLAHESPDDLDWPMRQAKPLLIFVNSMSDLFHASITYEYLAAVFAVMARCPHHVFQVLTKRHARMRSVLADERFADDVFAMSGVGRMEWPLPNVWLGVSVESQRWADARIPALLETPAAVRFLSCEPLLGPVDLRNVGHIAGPDSPGFDAVTFGGIDWVIAGGESGPRSRPMHPDWPRALRDQCVAAGVPFLFKQWGEWAPPWTTEFPTGAVVHRFESGTFAVRAGKKTAGRELDGRTWDEFPAVASC